MSINIKKIFDEVQYVEKSHETSLSFIPLDKVEVVQPYSPPEVDETNGINDEEFEDTIEAPRPSLCSSFTRRQRDGDFQSY